MCTERNKYRVKRGAALAFPISGPGDDGIGAVTGIPDTCVQPWIGRAHNRVFTS